MALFPPPSSSISGEELPGPWAKAYASQSKEQLKDAYKEWAESYDSDSIGKFGYVGPKRAAEAMSSYVSNPQCCRVADVGAGTGLVGEELAALGFDNIVGLDYSQDMLAAAERKNCYCELILVDLDEPADTIEMKTTLEPRSFDAAISVGTFTPHHVGIAALEYVIRLVRDNGILTLSLREDFLEEHENGFLVTLEGLEKSGELIRLARSEPELYTPKVSDSIVFRCWTWRVARQKSAGKI